MTENNKIYEEAQDVVFIDAYNLIYRAYHGNQSKLTNSEGMPTNAIYTVATMLLKLRKQFTNLAYTLAVFDGGGNFRKEINADYKANRKPMPDELKIQMPHIKTLFEILGWPIMQAENIEADDIIGTLALRAGDKGFNTYIVSSDKDFRQIVTSNINVLDTMQDVCYDPEKVNEKIGVYPENVVAWLALVGDESDNIIGVDKVGKGTAPKLLATDGNLENLIANQAKIKGKIGENLREAIANGQLLQSVELATLKTDVEINFTKKELRLKDIDNEARSAFCDIMNFKSFARNIKP
jgi:DNA polymerase-1